MRITLEPLRALRAFLLGLPLVIAQVTNPPYMLAGQSSLHATGGIPDDVLVGDNRLPKPILDLIAARDRAYLNGDRARALQIQLELVEWAATRLPELHPALALERRKLAWLLHELGRHQQAYNEINTAIRLYRGIAALHEPAKENLADSLSNLASILKALGKSKERLTAKAEEVKIYQELSRKFPDTLNGKTSYRRELAKAFDGLGQTLAELGRLDDALVATTGAVRIYQEMLRNKQVFLVEDLAGALNNLGIRYASRGLRQQAIEPARQACAIYRSLSDKKSSGKPDLARCLSNLGLHYKDLGRYDMALSANQEAVRILQSLISADPGILGDLAMAIDNLGGLYAQLGNTPQALDSSSQALAIYRKLADGGRPMPDRQALVLSNMANHLARLGRNAEALPLANEAITLYRDLAKAEDGYLLDLARVLNNAGFYYDRIGKATEAISSTQEALRIYSRLMNAGMLDPEDISRVTGRLALLLLRVGRVVEALPGFRTAVIADVLNLQSQLPLIAEVNRPALMQQIGTRWQYSFYAAHHGLAGARLALFTRLNRQGLLQDIQRNQVLMARNGEHRAIYEQLLQITSQLSNASISMKQRQQLLEEKQDWSRISSGCYRVCGLVLSKYKRSSGCYHLSQYCWNIRDLRLYRPITLSSQQKSTSLSC